MIRSPKIRPGPRSMTWLELRPASQGERFVVVATFLLFTPFFNLVVQIDTKH